MHLRGTCRMIYGSLCSGIDGLGLGLEWAGMKGAWQVEKDEWRRNILRKRFPDARQLSSLEECGIHNLTPVDLICAGFPCQPFSLAGKRRGKDDDRYLWPEVRRIVEALGPPWFLGENVPGIIRISLDTVLSDLEALGYATRTFVVPACAFGAPHIRQRVWIVAHTESYLWRASGDERSVAPDRSGTTNVAYTQRDGHEGTEFSISRKRAAENRRRFADPGQEIFDVADPKIVTVGAGLCETEPTRQWGRRSSDQDWWATEPGVCRVAHGVPDRVHRLKALGDAVSPYVSLFLGRMILEAEKEMSC